jgi:protease-4
MEDTRIDMTFKRMCEPWFVLPETHAALDAAMQRFSKMEPQAFLGLFGGQIARPKYEVREGVAIVPVNGTMVRKPSMFERIFFGISALDDIESMLTGAATDSAVSSIILNIDSGGGSAMGTPELASLVDIINRDTKPIVTFTSGVMGSAAYYLGAASSEIIATPSAAVGGVGTVISFLDVSRLYEMNGVKREVITNDDSPYKGVGMPGAPISEKHRDYLKEIVNDSSATFKTHIRTHRKGVTNEGMNGKTYSGQKCVAMGLCDTIGGMTDAMRSAKQLAEFRRKK